MGAVLSVSRVLRSLTEAFVARAPVDVELEAAVVTDDGEGGRTVSRGPARPPQRVTLCEPGSSGYGPPAASTDGVRRAVDFLLVAAWDADVRLGDEFTYAGARLRVEGILPANGWETRAYVVRAGNAS